MKLRDLGERKAVELIWDLLGERGIDAAMKDDCAALDLGDEYLLITTDMISEHAHIPEKAKPWQVGWHIVAINLSDIAAMGGEPFGVVVALGLPDNYDVNSLEKMVEGMRSCASNFNTTILGGDTKEVKTLTLSGCAFGRVAKTEIMLRKGAKPGDVVAVTGELGSAASAYYTLKNNPDDEKAIKDLMEVHPRVKEGIALSKTGVVTACMDISDGLASSIHQLSILNDIAFQLDFNQVPVSNEAKAMSKKMNMPIEELAIYFGGDYELLVTLDREGLDIAQKALSEIGTKLSPIGRVLKDKENILIKDDVPTFLENKGFEHFRRRP